MVCRWDLYEVHSHATCASYHVEPDSWFVPHKLGRLEIYHTDFGLPQRVIVGTFLAFYWEVRRIL